MEVKKVNFNDPSAAKTFSESLKETGFGVVSHHGIPRDLIDSVYADWKTFFKSDSKFDYLFDKATQSGYFPMGSENAKDSPVKDLKEFFHVYDGQVFPKELSRKTIELRNALMSLGSKLLTWIEEDLPKDIREKLSMPLSNMSENSPKNLFRIIHYPPLNGNEEPGAVRAAAHEDINLITLLPASTAMGLQVKDRKGSWHTVPGDYGDIVVNVGDMLQEATDSYFKSTTHRVINPVGSESNTPRYSMPLFVHPHENVRLSKAYLAGEYLTQRLKEIGLK